MKTKTIKKVLQAKFDDWCKSISDPDVRKLVQDNTIITGGCIPSMLLQEPVNDFDIYFTNKETVLAVANYYVNMFKANKHGDGREVIMEVIDCDNNASTHNIINAHESGRVKIHIKSAGIASAEGASNYEYFESRPQEEAEDFVDFVTKSVSETDDKIVDTKSSEKYKPVFMSANAITLSDKIQIVIRFYGDAATIHQHYDYVHCTNYWLSSTGQLTLLQHALEAILAKELIYVGSKYPVCSVIRTRKFIKRGWSINAGQYLKMCFQISKLDLTDINVLEDQLIGVDAAYFGQLISAMRQHEESCKKDNKEFNMDYGYLATIIDRIF